MESMAKQGGKVISIQTAEGGVDLSQTASKLAAVRAALREEYEKNHRDPWIVAYSGGKDSTLLLQLVFEAVQAVAPKQRRRQVHIVANDTQVESPLVADHLTQSIAQIREFIGAKELPMTTKITKPYTDQTFWVNVIGRGYIPPTRNFRWCTDRLKNYADHRIHRRADPLFQTHDAFGGHSQGGIFRTAAADGTAAKNRPQQANESAQPN